MQQDSHLKQMPLNFAPRKAMKREDFMVSQCNQEAFKMVESWPDWFGSGLFIYGPKGCGKSHLGHLFADKVKSAESKPTAVKIIAAADVNMHNFKRIAAENTAVIIENVEPKNNNEALFHLFNLFNVPHKFMLWSSELPPARMKFPLKDLQSRLNMLPCVAISEPDDMMLQMLVVKLFNDKQLNITQEILNYIVKNATRSFAYIEQLVDEIDEISLAYQTAVNYIIVKKAMENITFKNKREPDLFEDY